MKKKLKSALQKVNKLVEGTICISGLITALSSDPLFGLPGLIIWIGTIFIWILSGITVNSLTNVPVETIIGPWYIGRRKKRRK